MWKLKTAIIDRRNTFELFNVGGKLPLAARSPALAAFCSLWPAGFVLTFVA
jgi:hypothetical protein